MVYENDQSKTSNASNEKSFKETFKSGSADEVRDKAKSVVEKGVAAVAGALKGFNKETERSGLPEQARGAVHQAAEATKSAASSISESARGLKEPLRDASQKLRDTASDMRNVVRGEVDKTKGAFRSGAAGAGAIGAGSTSYGGPQEDPRTSGSMGMGGSELDAATSPELPDISHTPMAMTDKKLEGKDLSKDLDE